MFGERGYLTFPTRALLRKSPQGFIAWCCSCCLPKPVREETCVSPRRDENFEEVTFIGEGEKVAVLKSYHSSTVEEWRCSDGKSVGLQLKRRSHASVDEKWLCNRDSHEGREVQVRKLRKCQSSDNEGRCDGSFGGGECVEIPVVKVHHAQDNNEHYGHEDDASISEEISSIVLPSHSKSASPSPIVGAGVQKGPGSVSSGEWPPSPEEDIDRLVAIHQQRSSLSSLGPRSDSLASVYSGAGEGQYGTVAVKGEVEFGLEYNYKAGALEIHVKQCRDLAPVDIKRNRSDPYVKVYLLPDKSKSGKRKTKVKKHTLNPVFEETLKFQITLHGLETRTLWLTVWHSDMFGRNDFLGEVMMTLENKVFDDPSPHWYPLQERTEPFDDLLSYKGDLIIGLKFVPPDVTSAMQKKGKRSSRGSLNVLVKEAKNLTAVKANGTSDPFCKSYLLPDKGRSSKQKTPVLRRTCSPVWNYTFIYEDVSLQELSERSLELTVWDHDRLASNEFLGGLRFNLGTGKHYGKAVDWMDATGKEVTLWQHMLERPNFWVEGCLTLRPSLEHRSSS